MLSKETEKELFLKFKKADNNEGTDMIEKEFMIEEIEVRHPFLLGVD